MKKIMLFALTLFQYLFINAQEKLQVLRVDINNNTIVDVLNPTDKGLEMSIDNKKYLIPFELFGFEHFYDLSFNKNVLTISGSNDGTGLYSYTYKFRNNQNTKKIELIGFDMFYKWVKGNVTKSFNANTGGFEVIVEQYNEKKKKMETTKHTGKASLNKILLTNIDKNTFNKLAAVGKQYEPE